MRQSFSKRLKSGLGGALLAGLGGLLLWMFWLPDVNALKSKNPKTTRLMQIRLRQAKKAKKPYRLSQAWVPLERISPHLRHAVLVAEDGRFYQHKGLDYEALRLSLKHDWEQKKFSRGGSTITQQVAKNLYLTPRKSVLRKSKELLIALKLERTLSKRRILEIYLNIAEWGDGVFGAEAAARAYFHKPASALTVEEAAALASVLPSPRRHSPLSSGRFVAARKARVLRWMERAGYVPAAQPVAVSTVPVTETPEELPEEPEEEEDAEEPAEGGDPFPLQQAAEPAQEPLPGPPESAVQ